MSKQIWFLNLIYQLNLLMLCYYLLENVSAQKRLRGGVRFVNSIPKNPSGKILRRVLKDLIKQSKL